MFRPNYRGSVGYGDAVALGRVPHLVSRPGKDILEGIDALVKDGIADPDHLTVGGFHQTMVVVAALLVTGGLIGAGGLRNNPA